MTLRDKTERGQTEALTIEIELPHAPRKVWRALTEPELIDQWLLPATGFSLAHGTEFMLQAPAFPGWDGKVQCRVLEIEPERKLSYTWEASSLATVVTFSLTPTEAGTQLSIVQSGFKPEQKQNLGGARYGWKMVGEKLIALLERVA
jgi:uncharacterized protein YndB with AHSA1/START domain